MSLLVPFRALRPAPDAAAAVASVPYDVVSTDEARALAADNPLSFLHVTRAEVDLPAATNQYDATVYDQAVRNFEELKRAAPLVIDDRPSLYLYRLRMGTHEQTGVAGCFSLDEYDRDLIKKHEKTRKDKEDDRTRHMLELRAQTGIVFLTYRASAVVDAVTAQVTSRPPLYDFDAADGVRHTVWQVVGADVEALVRAFGELPALYIADGHHRAASAARARDSHQRRAAPARQRRRASSPSRFPIARCRSSPTTASSRISAVRRRVIPREAEESRHRHGGKPEAEGTRGRVDVPRRRVALADLPAPPEGAPRAETLDVELLHRHVLEPLLGIGDVRTDKRIDFVGGIRGPRRSSAGQTPARPRWRFPCIRFRSRT